MPLLRLLELRRMIKGQKSSKAEAPQRFKIYRYVASKLIGRATFEHFEYELASSYSLINRNSENIEATERMIVNMFRFTYPNLREVQV